MAGLDPEGWKYVDGDWPSGSTAAPRHASSTATSAGSHWCNSTRWPSEGCGMSPVWVLGGCLVVLLLVVFLLLRREIVFSRGALSVKLAVVRGELLDELRGHLKP